jgi:superfamily II DNA or RNA helicase
LDFRKIDYINVEYRNQLQDVVNEFYIPVLSEAKVYKRAVGYFSSELLIKISKGIGQLIKNGGNIELLISPELTPFDYEALKKFHDTKSFFDSKIQLTEPLIDDLESFDRLGLLFYLLETKKLIIKFAVLKTNKGSGIYHEKLGVLHDSNGNIIAFTGSSNETAAALDLNYEAFDVFMSWKNSQDFARCNLKDMAFSRLWNGVDDAIDTIDLSDLIQNKLLKFKPDNSKFVLDIDEYYNQKKIRRDGPKIPEGGLHQYQIEAISQFKKNNYVGIFDMATGTGKTFTALGAVVNLYNHLQKLFVIVVAPFIHLVDQWSEEAKKFNITPLLIYHENVDWRQKLERKIEWFKNSYSSFEFVITTNTSFTDQSLIKSLESVSNNIMIIVDEAHNFGSKSRANLLNTSFNFRLALSATIIRHNDEEGTKKLFEYFEKIVFSYSLEEAIQKGNLTEYYYYPIVTYLSFEEAEKYYQLSNRIYPLLSRGYNNLGTSEAEILKILLLKRSRLLASSKGKLTKLFQLIDQEYRDEKDMLIYCGSVSYSKGSIEKLDEDIRQIDYVIKKLGLDFHMKVSKFTAQESRDERINLIDQFKSQNLQALVAIKCLDEGVNIPSIKTAFIIASSTNPREYIQRRGRLLRTHNNKKFVKIYDFVTLIETHSEADEKTEVQKDVDQKLAIKELIRIKDFSKLSKNPVSCNDIINSIEILYNLDKIEIDEIEGDIKWQI